MKKIMALTLAVLMLVGLCSCARTVSGKELFAIENVDWIEVELTKGTNSPAIINPIIEMFHELELTESKEVPSATTRMIGIVFVRNGREWMKEFTVTDGAVKYEGQWYKADTSQLYNHLLEKYG